MEALNDLNLISQLFDQCSILSMSCCSWIESATDSMVLYRRQLSAKCLTVVCGDTLAAVSFTYRRNISEPSTVLFGRPERTVESDEVIRQGQCVASGGKAMN